MSRHLNYIRQHGTIDGPIYVKALSNGDFQIVDGHHRWLAAQRMGLTRVPIRILAD